MGLPAGLCNMDSTVRTKRPLEPIDGNARGSNGSEDSRGADASYKKPKRSSRSVDAALMRARDVNSTMIPTAGGAHKTTTDQSIYAKGTVERLHHDKANQTLVFFLISHHASDVEYAELPVLIRGHWVNDHLANGALMEHDSIILTFKEARIEHSQTDDTHASGIAGLSNTYILFDRGIELWVAARGPSSAQATAQLPGAKSWAHYKLFSQAQHVSTYQQGPVIRNHHVPEETVMLAPRAGRATSPIACDPAMAEARSVAEASTSINKNLPENGEQRTSRVLRTSPPTGVTQLEAGTLSHVGSSTQDLSSNVITQTPETDGFQSVKQLRAAGLPNRDVNVIGIVLCDINRVYKASNGKSVTIKLVDPSVGSGSADDWEGGLWLGATYLDTNETHFPIVQKGDVLLIRMAKTVCYRNYTRLSIFPDQLCDWSILPLDSLRALPEAALLSPIHRSAFRVCPGTLHAYASWHPADVRFIDGNPPSEVERNEMQRLAIWAREQIISAAPLSLPLPQAAEIMTLGQEYAVQIGLEDSIRPRVHAELALPAEGKESSMFDFVGKVSGLLWQGHKNITVEVTDYTANTTLRSADPLEDEDRDIPSNMILKILLWQNEAPDDVVDSTMDLLRTKDAIFLFRGLRARQYHGAINAHGRLNKLEFEIKALQPIDPLYLAFSSREKEYLRRRDRAGAVASASRQEGGGNPTDALPAEQNGTSVHAKPVVQDTSEKTLTKLCDLKAPADLYDPAAFFDCACEITEDVASDTARLLTTVSVTDFTVNELFWLNSNNADYPQARIILHIAIFGDRQREKVASLRQGDRVILRNVRSKYDKQGNLEGHVGERNLFRVTELKKGDGHYSQLEANFVTYMGGGDLEGGEPASQALSIGPSKTFDGVACKFAGCQVDDDVLHPLALDCDKVFRLRGRVIDYSPRRIEDFLLVKCMTCNRHLATHERLCGECQDGVVGEQITRQWCISLRMEIEPKGCNIELDAVETKRAVWIVVIEEEGETIFMNGLQPFEESLDEARRLLRPILENPSQGNNTNPIFDFCVKKAAGQRLLLMCDSALRRKNTGLPWV